MLYSILLMKIHCYINYVYTYKILYSGEIFTDCCQVQIRG